MPNLFGREKPWVLLGISRKEYDSLRLWTRVKLSRNEFGILLTSLPDEFFKDVKLRVDVEKLIQAIFSKSGEK
ncbi:MAG: hypothetical protein AAGU21_12085 [Solidesulfovibrio sp.]|uniref:hypothetical protein n=1 Tax=Solidesulfovibrio sp. TaxID=2910990 RepID=UPI003158854D